MTADSTRSEPVTETAAAAADATVDLQISVGELARFSLAGDINFRFAARSSALAGIRGHQTVQKSRGEDYVPERPVALTVVRAGLIVRVQGRVDGFVPTASPPVVEEIKTLRQPVASANAASDSQCQFL